MEYDLEFRKKLLATFEFVDRFFKDNNIPYFGCGGTVLGAIRHKGLIPWDDDIDIYVLREDYNRLLSLNGQMNKMGYNFVCIENDENYYLPFGKIEDVNTTLLESHLDPIPVGVYVDIFPLDFFDESCNEITKIQNDYYNLFQKYQRAIEKVDFVELFKLVQGLHINTLIKRLECFLYRPFRKYLYHKILRFLSTLKRKDGKYCVCVPTWIGKVFLSEWFKKPMLSKFELYDIFIPGDYDSYLTLLYGDYMTPPPIEERTFSHGNFRYYLNLRERLNYSEVMERIHKGEKIVI